MATNQEIDEEIRSLQQSVRLFLIAVDEHNLGKLHSALQSMSIISTSLLGEVRDMMREVVAANRRH